MSFVERYLLISTFLKLFLLSLVTLSKCQYDSPCPNIFQYRQDRFGTLFGYIEVPIPNTNVNKIVLDVQFSVGNVIYGSNGNIELTAGRLNTLEDILNRRRIRYNINFPYWTNIPPQITGIAINNRVLCSGPPISRRLVSVVSTVNLQHVLTLTTPLGYDVYGPFENDGTPTQFLPPIDNKFETTQRPLITRPDNICGLSHNANSLIIGGKRSRKGAHPWLGALFAQKVEGISFTCGTTLVSKRHTVTAAHCVHTKKKRFRADELWIVLGRENIQSWSNDGAQIIQAEAVHIHPDFKFTTADGDIAIIALAEDAIFSTLIRPACLWSEEANIDLIINQLGVVVGWGKDESGKTTSEPRETYFPVVSGEECLRSNVGFYEITSSRTFCAGYKNKTGPCNGDSGSGFLMKIKGRWTLRGIVSMSLATPDGNCDLTQYVVFSDVTQYKEWMLQILNN